LNSYTPGQLLNSFVVNDLFARFRKPDHPEQSFTRQELEELLKVLSEQDLRYIPNARQQIDPLIEKIRRSLALLVGLDVDMIQRVFRQMSEPDLAKTRQILWDLFRMGIKEREEPLGEFTEERTLD
jgi:hypothetical protein